MNAVRRFPMAVALLIASASGPVEASSVRDRIYPAPLAPLSLGRLPGDAAIISVETSDGLSLKGIAQPARPGMPMLLIFHGNGSSAADTIDWFRPLGALGYGIVAAEYRGYSANPGVPDEAGLAADADAFYALARQRAGGAPVYVIGHSLGGGVAFILAGRHRLDALFTIATFTRLRAMAPRIARSLVPDAYRNEAAVPTLDEPFFLIHGLRDETVSAQEANLLHNAATDARRDGASFVLADAGHHPDGATIAAIVEVARGKLASGTYGAKALPASVTIILFGASAPVSR